MFSENRNSPQSIANYALEKPDITEFLDSDDLMHYGMPKRSGRYPWGSGDNPYQHSGDFLSRIDELKKQGFSSDTDIAKELKMSTTEFRLQKRLANHERRALEADRARSLRADGKSLSEITKIMGYANDSSIRSLLNQDVADNNDKARVIAGILKKELAEKGMIDVGYGVERELGVSKEKLQEAIRILELEGYHRYPIGIPQVTNQGQQTNTPILCNPDVEYKDVYNNMGDIQSVGKYHSVDGGSTFNSLQYPASLDSKRIDIRYAEDGGITKDGVIELRRGVNDLDLGPSHYAQVRILVDGNRYLKGMAMYSDNMPDGVDVVFNTNKTKDVPKSSVMKKISDDPDNPFGALIKANGQSMYIDINGKEKLSPINKLKEEGDWDSMSKNLSSQFLSKQPMQLIKKQLNLTYDDKMAEFDEIMSLNNPTIKRKLLMDFANECDSATIHLKAAALPRQKTQVILPIDKMKETEIYAPNYNSGEKVALVRYPHGGTFEIPILTVNNKNSSARSILGNVLDAVGINSKVAERLSGADFDGDQVVVIPISDRVKIKSTPALAGLKNFDPKTQYSTEGLKNVKLMTKSETQKQMGMISNLITDMTLRAAPTSEIARAVRHSMVVIDAEKHKLNYKQSEKDNGIAALKKTYQVRVDDKGNVKEGGASTLMSRKKQDVRIPERQGSGVIDPKTGKVTYKSSGRTYIDKNGKVVEATTVVKRMSLVDDVRTLSSGTPQENAYADYANKVKSLANQARKASVTTSRLKYDSNAKKTYQEEVNSLDAKLNVAIKNAPKERRAMAIANSEVKAKQQENPDMDKKELKKASQIAITKARQSVGASGKESRITITDREWEAIQLGAVSDSKLSQLLRYTDSDVIRQRATPRTTTELSTAKINKMKSMLNSGYTNAEIAKSLGISTSTISKYT